MQEEEKLNPGHAKVRGFLRIAGPLVLGLGVLLIVIGFGSALSARSGPPRYFWCAFLGMPITFVGALMVKFAFVGAVTRYMARESAPIAKDTFNYIADGTKEGVRDIAGAMKDGFVGDFISCPHCRESNDSDAKFCNECGKGISLTKQCSKCDTKNDLGAKFCDDCGEKLTKSAV